MRRNPEAYARRDSGAVGAEGFAAAAADGEHGWSEGKFMSLAIANPEHAPYGMAAVAALTRIEAVRHGEAEDCAGGEHCADGPVCGVGQCAGGDQISLTSASTAHMAEVGTFVRVPRETYPEIRQCAVVMKKSEHRADAHAFLAWLRSPAVQKGLPRVGLDPAN